MAFPFRSFLARRRKSGEGTGLRSRTASGTPKRSRGLQEGAAVVPAPQRGASKPTEVRQRGVVRPNPEANYSTGWPSR